MEPNIRTKFLHLQKGVKLPRILLDLATNIRQRRLLADSVVDKKIGQMAEGDGQKRIAVVGEGVVGMSTLLAIRKAFPQTKLTIFSDRPFADTSSYGPAGIFRVDSDSDQYQHWAKQTFELWAKMANEQNPVETGVQMVSGHIQSDDRALLERQERAMAGIVHNFHWMTDREIGSIFPIPSKFGIHFTTYAAEGRRYVPWLKTQLGPNSGGVEFISQKLDSIQQLVNDGSFSVVINCAGLDAGKLSGDDDTVYPNRGVAIEIFAPGQSSHFAYQDLDTFCLPLVGDRLLLGTLRQNYNWDKEVTKMDTEDIWKRMLRVKPTIKNAKILGQWCGLRPVRSGGIRLDHKMMESENGEAVQVIHNYGHGSNGFVLSWGCAQDVVELIKLSGRAG